MNTLQAPPKRRNRAPKPAWSFAGLTLEQWQADSKRISWAQTTPEYRDMLTVLLNERTKQHLVNQPGGHSESFHLGVVRGYEAALAVVQAMATGATPPPGQLGDPDYPNDNQ